MQTQIDDWVKPEVRLSRPEVRRRALESFTSQFVLVIRECWAPYLPSEALAKAERCVHTGVRHAVRHLMLSTRALEFDLYWGRYQESFPRYWEPPVAQSLPAWPEHQLRATRWTASLIALHVRNALENIHAAYTSDATKPALNRALRNNAYQRLLDRPDLAWDLSAVPRTFVTLALHGQPSKIPAVAG